MLFVNIDILNPNVSSVSTNFFKGREVVKDRRQDVSCGFKLFTILIPYPPRAGEAYMFLVTLKRPHGQVPLPSFGNFYSKIF